MSFLVFGFCLCFVGTNQLAACSLLSALRIKQKQRSNIKHKHKHKQLQASILMPPARLSVSFLTPRPLFLFRLLFAVSRLLFLLFAVWDYGLSTIIYYRLQCTATRPAPAGAPPNANRRHTGDGMHPFMPARRHSRLWYAGMLACCSMISQRGMGGWQDAGSACAACCWGAPQHAGTSVVAC